MHNKFRKGATILFKPKEIILWSDVKTTRAKMAVTPLFHSLRHKFWTITEKKDILFSLSI